MAGRGRPLSGGVTSQLVTENSKEEEGCERCWGSQGGLPGGGGREGSDAGAGRGVFNDPQGEAETLTFSTSI